MVAIDPQFKRAEDAVLKAARESQGTYSPGQVLDRARHETNVPESILRSALWYLLDERRIVLSPERKVKVSGT